MNDALEALRWKKAHVGPDGFVCLVDWMGNDSSIVQAARVSYGAGTKTVHDDRGLIRYLMRHRHTTPFEMAEIKLMVRVPMDVWRQWIRHRTASVNEYSTRYSEAIDSAATTPPEGWRLQAGTNRQGSAGYLDPEMGKALSETEKGFLAHARNVYETRLSEGVAREQARKDLPLSTYTEAYWKVDLHNLFHFLALRLDAHAQIEIREFANAIAAIVRVWVPQAWEAFEDYRLKSLSFTGPEREALRDCLTLRTPEGFIERFRGLSKREQGEFSEKLERLGIYLDPAIEEIVKS